MSGPESEAVRLASVGGGNMAQAILLGAISAGAIEQRDIVVADPDEVKRRAFEDAGVATAVGISELTDRIGPETQILLAVKPQMLNSVAAEVRAAAGTEPRIVVSILAGVRGERIAEALGGEVRVVRAMPNTPARIGRGVTALAMSAGAGEGDDALARTLLGAVGIVVDLEEDLFDAFTAVAGSGPAYVFALAEAMVNGARRVGIPDADADRIVREVVAGSGALLREAVSSRAGDLRAAVTSKGGTTAAALGAWEQAGVMESIAGAIEAARDRGRELGG